MNNESFFSETSFLPSSGRRKLLFGLLLVLFGGFLSFGQNISKAEYFFDTDPGFGLATAVSLAADTSDLSFAWDININALSQGFHALYE